MMTTVPSSSPYNNMEHSFSPSDLNFMVIASIIQAFFFIYTVYLLLNGAASKFASSISGDASLQIFTFLHVLSGFDTHISTQLHLDEPAFTSFMSGLYWISLCTLGAQAIRFSKKAWHLGFFRVLNGDYTGTFLVLLAVWICSMDPYINTEQLVGLFHMLLLTKQMMCWALQSRVRLCMSVLLLVVFAGVAVIKLHELESVLGAAKDSFVDHVCASLPPQEPLYTYTTATRSVLQAPPSTRWGLVKLFFGYKTGGISVEQQYIEATPVFLTCTQRFEKAFDLKNFNISMPSSCVKLIYKAYPFILSFPAKIGGMQATLFCKFLLSKAINLVTMPFVWGGWVIMATINSVTGGISRAFAATLDFLLSWFFWVIGGISTAWAVICDFLLSCCFWVQSGISAAFSAILDFLLSCLFWSQRNWVTISLSTFAAFHFYLSAAKSEPTSREGQLWKFVCEMDTKIEAAVILIARGFSVYPRQFFSAAVMSPESFANIRRSSPFALVFLAYICYSNAGYFWICLHILRALFIWILLAQVPVVYSQHQRIQELLARIQELLAKDHDWEDLKSFTIRYCDTYPDAFPGLVEKFGGIADAQEWCLQTWRRICESNFARHTEHHETSEKVKRLQISIENLKLDLKNEQDHAPPHIKRFREIERRCWVLTLENSKLQSKVNRRTEDKMNSSIKRFVKSAECEQQHNIADETKKLISSLEKDKSVLDDTVKSLQAQLAERESCREPEDVKTSRGNNREVAEANEKEVAQLQKQVEELKSEKKMAYELASDKEKTLVNLRKELRDLKKQDEELRKQAKSSSESEIQLTTDKDKVISDLRTELESVKVARDEGRQIVSDKDKTISDLQTDIENTRLAREGDLQAAATKDQAIRDLQNQIQSAKVRENKIIADHREKLAQPLEMEVDTQRPTTDAESQTTNSLQNHHLFLLEGYKYLSLADQQKVSGPFSANLQERFLNEVVSQKTLWEIYTLIIKRVVLQPDGLNCCFGIDNHEEIRKQIEEEITKLFPNWNSQHGFADRILDEMQEQHWNIIEILRKLVTPVLLAEYAGSVKKSENPQEKLYFENRLSFIHETTKWNFNN